MQSTVLVSVVIPFFNADAYLAEAVESVLAQTCDDWELLLIDDGSSDGGPALARSYAGRSPERVQVLSHADHANLGCSASRNVGLGAARGEWVAMLDADDLWKREKLAEQVALAERLGVDAVMGAPRYWRSWQPQTGGIDSVPGHGLRPGVIYHPPELAYRLYPLGQLPAPCTSDLLIRREALLRVGGSEVAFRLFYEDQPLLSKLYLTSTFAVSDATWTFYRVHDASISAAMRESGRYDAVRLFFLRWLQSYYAEYVQDERLHAALRRALDPYEHPFRHLLQKQSKRAMRWMRRGVKS